MKLEQLGLSTRTVKTLERHRIETVDELISHTEASLKDLRNVGPTTVAEIKSALRRHKLALQDTQLSASDQRDIALVLAAKNFVGVFDDGMLANHLAAELTCAEVEAVVGLLLAAGRVEMADHWVSVHAASDAEGDEHYHGEVADAA